MQYFTLNEFLKSETADRLNILNKPNGAILKNLTYVGEWLDNIRREYGKPIYINSGYRCNELNNAVGGTKNSDHLIGCAADITTKCGQEEDRKLYDLIKKKFPYNQLIWEKNWIHYSVYRDNKRQAF